MLRHLRATNFAILSDVEIELGGGMNVLTGETGAGKSLIVEAVNLLRGGRASADIPRTGADEAVVEATVDVPDDLRARVSRRARGRRPAHADDGDEVFIRRIIQRGGRSRCYVNGALTTAARLGELGALLIDLSGQHQHQGLVDPGAPPRDPRPVRRATEKPTRRLRRAPTMRRAGELAAMDAAWAELGAATTLVARSAATSASARRASTTCASSSRSSTARRCARRGRRARGRARAARIGRFAAVRGAHRRGAALRRRRQRARSRRRGRARGRARAADRSHARAGRAPARRDRDADRRRRRPAAHATPTSSRAIPSGSRGSTSASR